jgi:hypothetical protein
MFLIPQTVETYTSLDAAVQATSPVISALFSYPNIAVSTEAFL